MPLLRHRLAPATSIPGSSSVATTLAGPESKPRCFCPILCSFQLGTVSGRAVVASRLALRLPVALVCHGTSLARPRRRGAPQRHAEAFFIGDMPSAHASDSAFSVCAEGVERWLSGSFLWRSASTAGESQTTKTGAKAGFSAVLCSPGNAWEVRMVPRERLELSLCRQKRILNPPRLPIPPPRQWRRSIGRRLPLVNRVRGGKTHFR